MFHTTFLNNGQNLLKLYDSFEWETDQIFSIWLVNLKIDIIDDKCQRKLHEWWANDGNVFIYWWTTHFKGGLICSWALFKEQNLLMPKVKFNH